MWLHIITKVNFGFKIQDARCTLQALKRFYVGGFISNGGIQPVIGQIILSPGNDHWSGQAFCDNPVKPFSSAHRP